MVWRFRCGWLAEFGPEPRDLVAGGAGLMLVKIG